MADTSTANATATSSTLPSTESTLPQSILIQDQHPQSPQEPSTTSNTELDAEINHSLLSRKRRTSSHSAFSALNLFRRDRKQEQTRTRGRSDSSSSGAGLGPRSSSPVDARSQERARSRSVSASSDLRISRAGKHRAAHIERQVEREIKEEVRDYGEVIDLLVRKTKVNGDYRLGGQIVASPIEELDEDEVVTTKGQIDGSRGNDDDLAGPSRIKSSPSDILNSSPLPPHSTPTNPPSPTQQEQTESSTISVPASNPDQTQTETVNLYAGKVDERKEALEEVWRQKKGIKKAFVWDILYENQRGIYLFGSPYFSPSTLFPFDPPAYTIPSHVPQPAIMRPTTTKSAAGNHPGHLALLHPSKAGKGWGLFGRGGGEEVDGVDGVNGDEERDVGDEDGRGKGKSRANGNDWENKPQHYRDRIRGSNRLKSRRSGVHQSISTPYTPQTYQLPSTLWRWLTNWMINMRQDGTTDERGWEYNYWFRKKGWSCHVGSWGWGRWVRRRMWVRLRMLDEEGGDEWERGGGRESNEKKLIEDILKAGREMNEINPVVEKKGKGGGFEMKRGDSDSSGQSSLERGQNPGRGESGTFPSLTEVEFEFGNVKRTLKLIVEAMSKYSLDRERLGVWKGWCEEVGEYGSQEEQERGVLECMKALKEVLGDEERRTDILKLMAYTSSKGALQQLWLDHGLVTLDSE